VRNLDKTKETKNIKSRNNLKRPDRSFQVFLKKNIWQPWKIFCKITTHKRVAQEKSFLLRVRERKDDKESIHPNFFLLRTIQIICDTFLAPLPSVTRLGDKLINN
jgi:hypothetical protein